MFHESIASGKKVIKAIQALKRKRNPDGSLDKNKTWEECSAGAKISGTLDFTQAFPQHDIKGDVLIETLFGYDNTDVNCVLKLKKNLCGLCDGNIACHKYPKWGTLKRGFELSQIDPCLVCKKGAILVVRVDDCFIF